MDKKESISRSTRISIDVSKSQLKQFLKNLEADIGKTVNRGNIVGTVYLLLDCSSSMADNKLEQAKKGSINFAEEAKNKGYLVGLIKFASSAELICEPQYELASFRTHIEKITANGSTNMTAAIRIASDKLLNKPGIRVMYIVTDGMPNNQKSAIDAANEAKKDEINIMTLGTDDADRDFLREVATQTELAVKVLSKQFEKGIVSMTKMLPKRTNNA